MNNFYVSRLPETIKTEMIGKSFPYNAKESLISFDELTYVHILHTGFDEEPHEGELICNRLIAHDLLDIFKILYKNKYPIERVCLIDIYDADDEASMADNNSSAFNYRMIWGTKRLSNHALGFAIDINPLYNPYISYHNGKEVIQPKNSISYINREKPFPYKITHEDLCYKIFTDHGFSWGGDWTESKDYQHFEKLPNYRSQKTGFICR